MLHGSICPPIPLGLICINEWKLHWWIKGRNIVILVNVNHYHKEWIIPQIQTWCWLCEGYGTRKVLSNFIRKRERRFFLLFVWFDSPIRKDNTVYRSIITQISIRKIKVLSWFWSLAERKKGIKIHYWLRFWV